MEIKNKICFSVNFDKLYGIVSIKEGGRVRAESIDQSGSIFAQCSVDEKKEAI